MSGEGRDEIRPLPPEFHEVTDTWAPENEEFPMPGTYRSLSASEDGDDGPAPRRTRSAFQVLAVILLSAVFLMGAVPGGVLPSSGPDEDGTANTTVPAVSDTPAEDSDTPEDETAATADEPEPIDVRATLVAFGTWGTESGDWLHFDEDGTGWCYDGEYFGLLTFSGDAESVRFHSTVTTRGEHLERVSDKPGESAGEPGPGAVTVTDTVITRAELTSADPFDLYTADPYMESGWDHFVPGTVTADLTVLESVRGQTAEELLSGSWGILEAYIPADMSFGVPYADIVVIEGGGGAFLHAVDTLGIQDAVYELSYTLPDGTVPAVDISSSGDLEYAFVTDDGASMSYTDMQYGTSAVMLLRESGVSLVLYPPFGGGYAGYFHYDD